MRKKTLNTDSFETLMVTEVDSFLLVELSQPQNKNALSPKMIHELTQVFQQNHKGSPYRGIFLQGAGTLFCSGADLAWMKDQVNFSLQQNRQDAEKLFQMFEAIQSCPVPVVTRVQGGAYGGALGILAVSDFVVCASKANFSFSEVRLGISPAVVSYFILRKCSRAQLLPFMSLALPFSATQGLTAGLVHQISDLSSEEFFSIWKKNLMALSPNAFRETKKLLQAQSLEKSTVVDLISQLRISPEGQEGLKSFLEKRSPNWNALKEAP